MVVVKKFAAQLQVKFSAELVNPLNDSFRLHPRIPIMIEPDFHPPYLPDCFSKNRSILPLKPDRVNAKYGRMQSRNEKIRLALLDEKSYTNRCRVRDEDWVPCDLSV